MSESLNLTQREAEYLIEIYRYFENPRIKDKGIGPSYFSNKFKVSRVTAYEILQKLLKRKILYKIKGKYYISERGESIGRRLIRRHRILEAFFVNILLVSSEEVCEKIRGMELFIDDDLIDRICSLLNHPKVCPHGYPIPRGSDCNVG